MPRPPSSAARAAAWTRSARTSPASPWPGASRATTSWSRARSSPTGPQQRDVCVKPWSSTSRCWSPGSVTASDARTDMDQPTGSPAPQDVQATFVATLADEWARGGVRAAVVCPGSRSTPLALALADHPGIRVHVHHDERSGGFLALGRALADGRPVVVLTTSGTAAVELHPAVVEAHHSGVPMLVCTADRPPELQDVGAAQTIDQQR